MNYILSQEEMDGLVPIQKLEETERDKRALFDLFFKHTTFKCIHTYKPPEYGYCDRCPLAVHGTKICHLPKDFSK